jgi:hypothetical protein
MKKTDEPAFDVGLIFRLVLALAIIAAPITVRAYDNRAPSPDSVAWEVFTQAVSSAASPSARELEFETWASDADLYERSPPRWPGVGEPRRRGECKRAFDSAAASAAGFPDDACIEEEVRRNWPAFRYLVAHDLTSKAGLARAFEKGLVVDLPADSIQVKADWIKTSDAARWLGLDEEDVRRIYYTRSEQDGAIETEYVLVALHLNSKRWTNWLWATFEHQLNPGRCDVIGCHDTFGAAVTDVAGREPANQDYGDCPKTPSLMAMFANVGLNPVWLNYCLKGSQVAFAEKDGRPKLLGNSVIDRINGHVPIAHSSCMTCHALASFNRSGEANKAAALVGELNNASLIDYRSHGFIWGVSKTK